MEYYFTNSENSVVGKIDDDGISRVSFLLDAEGPYQDEYKTWLSEGNTPNPYVPPPAPPPLTAAEKLEAAGLTVDELKELLGL